MTTLTSKLDASVNFIEKTTDGGAFEARYVRRRSEYITGYLSSHSGCLKGCRFCHLTQTNQDMFKHASQRDLEVQARKILHHYHTQKVEVQSPKADMIYWSFMARGEPLANEYLLSWGDEVLNSLGDMAEGYELASRVCISTIMPREVLRRPLIDVFKYARPMFYYSLYSLDPAFRAKWLPQAMDPEKALSRLATWQDQTGMLVKIHGAVIAGENDSDSSWYDICRAIDRHGMNVEFNLVPYNPFSPDLGIAATDLAMEGIVKTISEFGFKAQVKNRVGFDVKASCGMFVEPKKAGDPDE